jgi:hypothetical protein
MGAGPGWFHTATLTNVTAEPEYYYVVGDDATGWTKEFHFYSAPTPGVDSTFDMFAFGDLGQVRRLVGTGVTNEVCTDCCAAFALVRINWMAL